MNQNQFDPSFFTQVGTTNPAQQEVQKLKEELAREMEQNNRLQKELLALALQVKELKAELVEARGYSNEKLPAQNLQRVPDVPEGFDIRNHRGSQLAAERLTVVEEPPPTPQLSPIKVSSAYGVSCPKCSQITLTFGPMAASAGRVIVLTRTGDPKKKIPPTRCHACGYDFSTNS